VHDAERQFCANLAACYRLTAQPGWDDRVFTHISASLPGLKHYFPHTARHDIAWVIHRHPANGLAPSGQNEGLSLYILCLPGLHDDESIAVNPDEKPRLVRAGLRGLCGPRSDLRRTANK
jgi:ribulose-5-phosphate 4-epimerase/fuculose-1-phosphate aldolase